jgi:3alpha(or 20beta)-hydroxysteroid dehydrogenase
VDIRNRIAVVTGAAVGTGRGIARRLVAEGAAVVLADVDTVGGEQTRQMIRADGGDARFIAADMCSETDIARMVDFAVTEAGGLDILVNNAGVEITQLVADLEPEAVSKMLEVNILGTSLGIKHAFRAMRPGGPAGRGGAVVNISSVAATIAFPGIAVYSATKSAVDRLSRVAAMESGKLGYGVRVNCIYPGLVPTEMGSQLAQDVVTLGLFPSVPEAIGAVVGLTPQGRLGEVADMADAVVFLASDAARFITGAGLPVDGGMGM